MKTNRRNIIRTTAVVAAMPGFLASCGRYWQNTYRLFMPRTAHTQHSLTNWEKKCLFLRVDFIIGRKSGRTNEIRLQNNRKEKE